MRTLMVMLLTAVVLGCGCASAPPSPQPVDVLPCSARDPWCDPAEFAYAYANALLTNGPWVEIVCPPYENAPPVEQVMPHCVELIKAAILLASERNKSTLEPIDISQVQFRHKTVARAVLSEYQDDMYTDIVARVPLTWKTDVKVPNVAPK